MLYFCTWRACLADLCIIHCMTRTELLETLNRQAQIIWETYCEIYPRLVKFDCPQIKLNGRFTKTAGNCEVENNIINIGYKFFPKFHNEMFSVILPHEIAHQIDYNLNGLPKRWHGKSWQDIMLAYGLPADPYHQMEI